MNEKLVKEGDDEDISPQTLIQNLPNYTDGAYLVEYFDPENAAKRTEIQEEFMKTGANRASSGGNAFSDLPEF